MSYFWALEILLGDWFLAHFMPLISFYTTWESENHTFFIVLRGCREITMAKKWVQSLPIFSNKIKYIGQNFFTISLSNKNLFFLVSKNVYSLKTYLAIKTQLTYLSIKRNTKSKYKKTWKKERIKIETRLSLILHGTKIRLYFIKHAIIWKSLENGIFNQHLWLYYPATKGCIPL